MKKEEFLSVKKTLSNKLEKFKEKINAEYSKAVNEYLKANCSVEEGKVYDLVSGRKKLRVVVYSLNVQVIYSSIKKRDAFVMIHAGGWVLDKDSVPSKWKNLTIAGDVCNPDVLTLSEDQTNFPHPDSKNK